MADAPAPTPDTAVAATAAAAVPARPLPKSAQLPPLPQHGAAGGRSYIGVGVMREYREEWGLVEHGAAPSDGARASMPRSRTLNEIAGLLSAHAGGATAGSTSASLSPVAHGTHGAAAYTPVASAAPRSPAFALSRPVVPPRAAGVGGRTGDFTIGDEEDEETAALLSGGPATAAAPAAAAAGRAVTPSASSTSLGRSGSGSGLRDLGVASLAHVVVGRASPLAAAGGSGAAAGGAGAGAGDATGGAGLSKRSSSSSGLLHHTEVEVGDAVGKPVSIPLHSTHVASMLASKATAVTPPSTSVQALSLRREGKTVFAMVGLPARGKTFTARRLKRHLGWIGYKTELFNVGNYRRELCGAVQPAAFFDPTNATGEAARREAAAVACKDMLEQLVADVIDIGIFDATNTTRERRRWLRTCLEECEKAHGLRIQLVFIETICNDEGIIRLNVQETKLKSPDYHGKPEAEAVADFLRRIAMYESVYQTLSDSEEGDYAYIKVVDVGRQLIGNRVQGYLNSRVLFLLSNLHITPRPILLTRHGESEYNVQGRIGGDSNLAPRGVAYSLKLAPFINAKYPRGGDHELSVWTSTLRRTQATAAPIGREIVPWKALDEIDAGVCDGMTYEEIASRMPEEYAARTRNKFGYRYPRGESYEDIVHRLEPVIIELLRQRSPVLVVSHQATLRVLYAYLTDKPPETCPDVLVPLHTVIELTPRAYGCDEARHELM